MIWSRGFKYFKKRGKSSDGSMSGFRAIFEDYEHFNRDEKWKPENWHPRRKYKGNYWREKGN